MRSFAIEKFLGLQDGLGVVVDAGYAETALNIDFRDVKGRLKGLKSSSIVHAVAAVSSVTVFGGVAISSTVDTLYGNAASIKSSWGGTFKSAIIQSQLVLVNGVQPIKYDGTNVYNLGITPPVITGMTATGTGVGAITVVTYWKYKVTFVNGNGFESNTDTANEVSSGAFAAKASCDLAVIPTGAAADNVVSRKLYRTTDGGTVYYYLATIGDNTTTTYVDNTADAALGSTTYPTNHDAPLPELIIVEYASTRLLGVSSTNLKRLYFSLPTANFEGWPSTYYYDFQDDIRILQAIGERLVVITDSGLFVFIMPSTDVNAFYDRELDWKLSAKSTWTSCRFTDILAFRGPRGMYATNGVSVQFLSADQESLFDVMSTSQQAAASEHTLYYVLADILITDEVGLETVIESISDTYAFDSEYGTVIRIVDSDTYTFSADLGIIVDVTSNATASQLLQVNVDYNNVHSLTSDSCTSLAFDSQNNIMYAGSITGLKRLFVGSRQAWKWKSEESYLNFPRHEKSLDRIEFWANGNVTVNMYVDGSLSWTKAFTCGAMTFCKEYTRTATGGPIRGRRFQIEFDCQAGAEIDPPFIYWFFVEGLDEPGRMDSAGATQTG